MSVSDIKHLKELKSFLALKIKSFISNIGIGHLLLLFLSCSATNEGMTMQTKIKNFTASMEPGIEYVIVDSNKTLFKYSDGLADIKDQKSVTLQTTMSAFSMTKSITSIAILQLAQDQKLNINDMVSKYVRHPYNQAITIEMLLTHTSGIPNPIPLSWTHLASEVSEYDETKALKEVLEKHPNQKFKPNTDYLYSNIGYWLLGEVIKKVSGDTYKGYVQKKILDPLGISAKEISFNIVNPADHAKGYLKRFSLINLLKRFLLESKYFGAYEQGWLHLKDTYLNGPSFGGLIGTAVGFSKILQDLLKTNSILLKDKSHMYEKHVIANSEHIDMTLTWHVSQNRLGTYYFKEGGGAGFHCEMRIYPEKGIASVVMVNRTSFKTKKFLDQQDAFFLDLKLQDKRD